MMDDDEEDLKCAECGHERTFHAGIGCQWRNLPDSYQQCPCPGFTDEKAVMIPLEGTVG